MLEIEHLSIGFQPGTLVLNDISFCLAEGESVALLGANGAGKTSLLQAIVGLMPYQGEIRLDQMCLSQKTVRDFRNRIGFVFQNPDDQLFCPTLWDDMAFGLENMGKSAEEIADIVKSWLERLGLAAFSDRSCQKLSGGEKRMAALATVLAMQPSLILLDEPTSFLDARSRKALESALCDLLTARIIATHNIRFADRMCSRAIVLNNGKIEADRDIHELLRDQALMERCGLDWIE